MAGSASKRSAQRRERGKRVLERRCPRRVRSLAAASMPIGQVLEIVELRIAARRAGRIGVGARRSVGGAPPVEPRAIGAPLRDQPPQSRQQRLQARRGSRCPAPAAVKSNSIVVAGSSGALAGAMTVARSSGTAFAHAEVADQRSARVRSTDRRAVSPLISTRSIGSRPRPANDCTGRRRMPFAHRPLRSAAGAGRCWRASG